MPLRRALVLIALATLGATTSLAQGTLRTFDAQDLGSAIHATTSQVRSRLVEAEQLDTAALTWFIAESTDSSARTTAVYPAIAWALLIRFGDSTFAAALQRVPPTTRAAVVSSVDRGAGIAYSRVFPRTWAIGTHARPLLPDSVRRPADSTWVVVGDQRYDSGDLNRQPGVEASSCGTLGYPADLLRESISGRVVLELMISAEGQMEEAPSVVSATHDGFVGSAERWLRDCRYSPGRRAGRAVRSRIWVPLSFTPQTVDVRGDLVYVVPVSGAVASRGVDFSYEVGQATTGDTTALRAVLEQESAVDTSGLGYFRVVVEALLRAVGDQRFATVAGGLHQKARENIVDMARAVGSWAPGSFERRYPRTAALSPRPSSEADTAVDTTAAVGICRGMHAEPPDSGVPLTAQPQQVQGSCTAPQYPIALRNLGLSGRVVLEFIIDTSGRAEPASIRAVILNHPAFVEAAKAAVRSCRFVPGRIGERAVRVRVQLPVNFTVN